MRARSCASGKRPYAAAMLSRRHIDEVVHLHQVDARRAQSAHRLFHLCDAGASAGRPHLRGEEQLRTNAEFRGEVADDLFRASVHRRRIDDSSAGRHELAENVLQRRALRG
jgi:hypothetical protein